jgi:hypothetical protein
MLSLSRRAKLDVVVPVVDGYDGLAKEKTGRNRSNMGGLGIPADGCILPRHLRGPREHRRAAGCCSLNLHYRAINLRSKRSMQRFKREFRTLQDTLRSANR